MPRPRKSNRGRRSRRRSRPVIGRWAIKFVTPVVFVLAAIIIVKDHSEEVKPIIEKFQLPLKYADVIRQQAESKKLDPALVAAIIYAESRFRPRTSSAGAKGLMQILPSTAEYIARKSGATNFLQDDLSVPQINIAYGSFYVRYLLNKYHGNELLTLAAYNAGEGRVDAWSAEGLRRGDPFDSVSEIPFPETRAYVSSVFRVRKRYQEDYRSELGL